MNSIETQSLRRTFTLERRSRKEGTPKVLEALGGIDLQVREGELFGLLGPNGAGKTTLIRILCTLLTPTMGTAKVDGHDIVKEVNKVRTKINMVSGGETCGYGILTPVENLRLFTELYNIPWSVAKPRIDYMLKVIGLEDKRNSRINRLSTGMRQRLNFARGFTSDPKVLFLDEPTVGLDVHSAMDVRRFLKLWLSEHRDKTILLTTHYMAEAEELCDRIAIIDKGKIVACDTPAGLKKTLHKEATLDLRLAGVQSEPPGWKNCPGVTQLTSISDAESQTTLIHILLRDEEATDGIIRMVAESGRRIVDLKTIQPSLEDVFLKLTGRSLGEDTTTVETINA